MYLASPDINQGFFKNIYRILLLIWDNLLHKCDMIKRNELDVGDVVFEILAKTALKNSSVTRNLFVMGFASK